KTPVLDIAKQTPCCSVNRQHARRGCSPRMYCLAKQESSILLHGKSCPQAQYSGQPWISTSPLAGKPNKHLAPPEISPSVRGILPQTQVSKTRKAKTGYKHCLD
ncbi:hypothetical protein BaRGS_00017015, partial [Batillaria attramentaria]